MAKQAKADDEKRRRVERLMQAIDGHAKVQWSGTEVYESVLEPFGMQEREVDAVVSTYFARYDLDGDGTINSLEELTQMLTNLAVKFNLPKDLLEIMIEAYDHASSLNLTDFTTWYKRMVRSEMNVG